MGIGSPLDFLLGIGSRCRETDAHDTNLSDPGCQLSEFQRDRTRGRGSEIQNLYGYYKIYVYRVFLLLKGKNRINSRYLLSHSPAHL